ncbi:hypothetical protein [Lactiplantibacillus plantarum]|uniref:hypothetical protein n=1 Tax=Lactiplantibacillus plantarum TaxID=1590 RepID=UPI0036F49F2A
MDRHCRQNSPFTSTSGAQLTGAKLHIPAGQTYNERATGQLKSCAVDLTTAEQPVFAAQQRGKTFQPTSGPPKFN